MDKEQVEGGISRAHVGKEQVEGEEMPREYVGMEQNDATVRHDRGSKNVPCGTVESIVASANKDTLTLQNVSTGDDRPDIVMVMEKRWSPTVCRNARKSNFACEHVWRVVFV